jgi:hypothetical protein
VKHSRKVGTIPDHREAPRLLHRSKYEHDHISSTMAHGTPNNVIAGTRMTAIVSLTAI